jgi:chitin disaccharide deacetylase
VTDRWLVVNADDFGLADSVNDGIVSAHEKGLVTATTLMVRRPAAAAAARAAARLPRLDVGIHVDLGEWNYRNGEWVADDVVVDPEDEEAVTAEVARQLDSFRSLTGRDPTHLDSHQHVHRTPPASRVLRRLGRRLRVPVRHQSPHITYRGDFYGQTGKGVAYPEALTAEALVSLLRELPPGVTELGCHPGSADPDLPNTYREEREVELAVLCDPEVRAAVDAAGIALTSFTGLPALAGD